MSNNSNINSLKLLLKIFESCYGPKAKLKLVQNSSGGYVTITSNSGRLLNCIRVTNPVSKVIISAIKTHLSIYGDGGLFLGLLATQLYIVWGAMVVDDGMANVPLPLVIKIIDKIQNVLMNEFFNSNDPIEIELNSIVPFVDYAKCILRSKPAACLSDSDIGHLSLAVTNCVLNLVPSAKVANGPVAADSNILTMGEVHFVLEEGSPSQNSKLIPGLLIEIPSSQNISIEDDPNNGILLYGCSLSGDTECLDDVTVIRDNDIGLVSVIANEIIAHLDRVLKSCNARIVGCQKVVHPRVKMFLKEAGVLVVDRLGLQTATLLGRMIGFQPLPSFRLSVEDKDIGRFVKCNVLELNDRRYLQLHGRSSMNVVTFYLCNCNEESLNETKVICNQAINGLKLLLTRSAMAVVGGGCLETQMISFLRYQVIKNHSVFNFTRATIGQITRVVNSFVTILESLAKALHKNNSCYYMIDNEFQHLWLFDEDIQNVVSHCACGSVTLDEIASGWRDMSTAPTNWEIKKIVNLPKIYDLKLHKQNAINSAIEVFKCLASVDLIINSSAIV